MDAVQRRGSPERMQYIKRFGACLLIMVMLLGFVEPPKSKAFAVSGSIAVAAAVFLASCGLSWSVLNASEDTFIDTVGGILNDYLHKEFAGQTIEEWAVDLGIASLNGKLMFPKLAVGKFADFAQWVVEKYSVTSGSSVELAEGSYITFADGQMFQLTAISSEGTSDGYRFYPTSFSRGDTIPYVDGITSYQVTSDVTWTIKCTFSSNDADLCDISFYDGVGTQILGFFSQDMTDSEVFFSFCVYNGYLGIFASNPVWSVGKRQMVAIGSNKVSAEDASASSSSIAMGLDKALDIPDTSSMDDDEALAVGVGAAAGLGLEALLQQILDAIRSNELATTQEITKAEEITEPETGTDINKLGLPALGAAFQTRFPFSIPWDFVAAVKLLAAPAVVPKWKVDLLQPVQARYGIFKGDTSITIDLGEYPLIGQVSRWISTFFFGVGLMMATKKLLWAT